MTYKRKRKSGGFADTKNYPHKRHPAKYNRLRGDFVEYITFTHSDLVELDNKEYETIPLTSNINEQERKKTKNISYVFPKVFVGKRSSLGKENKNYSLVKKDNEIVNNLFKTLPRENVPYSTNSKKKRK